MKKYYAISILSLLLSLISCERIELEKTVDHVVLPRFSNSVKIDSTYTYPQDTLYKTWLRQYNSQINAQTRSLSPEDEAFLINNIQLKAQSQLYFMVKTTSFPEQS